MKVSWLAGGLGTAMLVFLAAPQRAETAAVDFAKMQTYNAAMVRQRNRQPMTTRDREAAVDYLMQYGYISMRRSLFDALPVFIRRSIYRLGIKLFQRFLGLDADGELSEEIVQMMNTPRCGLVDMGEGEGAGASALTNAASQGGHPAQAARSRGSRRTALRRPKRFSLSGFSWFDEEVRYKIVDYSRTVSRTVADRVVARALRMWSDVANIRFRQVPEDADAGIIIRFAEDRHGDPSRFDGPSGVLAHAYYPTDGRGRGLAGDAHFDDSETWVFSGSAARSGVDLLGVMTHEFGHSLGLNHSSVQDAVMFPFAHPYSPDFRLHSNDVRGIRAIYGERRSAPDPDEGPKGGSPGGGGSMTSAGNGSCSGRVDALTQSPHDDDTYAFQGELFYKLLADGGVRPGFPRRTSDYFSGFPEGVARLDTAFTDLGNNLVYVVQGMKYWALQEERVMFEGDVTDLGFDRSFSASLNYNPFASLPFSSLFASFGRLLAIYGDERSYASYRREGGEYRSVGRARSTAKFRGIPFPVADAVQWLNGKVYFFRDDAYYRFNTNTRTVDDGYPKSTAKEWFGCET